jgi:hypothetical protein
MTHSQKDNRIVSHFIIEPKSSDNLAFYSPAVSVFMHKEDTEGQLLNRNAQDFNVFGVSK